jgi:heme exporter protein B
MSAFLLLIRRDLAIAYRQGTDTLAALLFFVVTGSLFPLALGPDPATLMRLAPGIVWIGALLAALLPLERLFAADYEDGSLEQLALSGLPLSALVGAKIAVHWLTTGLPLVLIAGPLSIMLAIRPEALGTLLAGLVMGTLALSLFGTMASAILLGARRGGVLMPLLVLPLAVPVLIFGTAAVDAVMWGLSPAAHLALLLAVLLVATLIAPWAGAAALRAALE